MNITSHMNTISDEQIDLIKKHTLDAGKKQKMKINLLKTKKQNKK